MIIFSFEDVERFIRRNSYFRNPCQQTTADCISPCTEDDELNSVLLSIRFLFLDRKHAVPKQVYQMMCDVYLPINFTKSTSASVQLFGYCHIDCHILDPSSLLPMSLDRIHPGLISTSCTKISGVALMRSLHVIYWNCSSFMWALILYHQTNGECLVSDEVMCHNKLLLFQLPTQHKACLSHVAEQKVHEQKIVHSKVGEYVSRQASDSWVAVGPQMLTDIHLDGNHQHQLLVYRHRQRSWTLPTTVKMHTF